MKDSETHAATARRSPVLHTAVSAPSVPATHENVAARLLCADTHPDHDTLCTFRRRNGELLSRSFAAVLEVAARCGVLKVGGITVAIDGTKILANTSKHAAVGYERAGEQMRQLDLEIAALLSKAEEADSTPLEDGLVPSLQAMQAAAGPVACVLIDSGFVSEQAVRQIEADAEGQPTGTVVLAAMKRDKHGRTVADLEKKNDPCAPAADAPFAERMIHRVATKAGRARYKLHQQTVEPVFGINGLLA